jgi:small subunit ribosomal protein S17
MAKKFSGVVVSTKPHKTILVSVASMKTHPVYKKQYRVTHTYMVHDEENTALVGDNVIIVESRPVSRHKRFRLDKITGHAAVAHTEPEASPSEVVE